MQDPPRPAEMIAAVVRFLKDDVAPGTSGRLSFQARVAANALEIVRRHLEQAPAAEAEEHQRLSRLLGRDGDLAELNAEIARRIASGEIDPAAPEVSAHLWATTLAKLALDQPTYASYRAALAERAAKET